MGGGTDMSAPTMGLGRRVLVVDDHVASASSLSLVLSLLGYDVRCAFDGVEALRCAAEFKPEIAILDLSIPLLDGYAVATRMRAMDATRDTLLVAMTGWGSDAGRATPCGCHPRHPSRRRPRPRRRPGGRPR